MLLQLGRYFRILSQQVEAEATGWVVT